MAEVIQYIVARRDLEMSAGKLAAQVAHASMGVLLPHFRGGSRYVRCADRYGDFADDIERWLEVAFAKVVVMVEDRAALDRVAAKLEERGVPHQIIRDACRTELEPEDEDGRTPTCIGVVPLERHRAPGLVRHLPLWRD